VPVGRSKYPVDEFSWSDTPAGVTAAGAEDAHAEPLEVRTLPVDPGEVKPVPPLAAGNVLDTPVVRFTCPLELSV
jgi:hypothetical protein